MEKNEIEIFIKRYNIPKVQREITEREIEKISGITYCMYCGRKTKTEIEDRDLYQTCSCESVNLLEWYKALEWKILELTKKEKFKTFENKLADLLYERDLEDLKRKYGKGEFK